MCCSRNSRSDGAVGRVAAEGILASARRDGRTPCRAAILGAISILLVALDNPARADSPSLTAEELAIVLTLSPLGPPPQDRTNAVSGNCQAIDFGRNLFF